MTRPKLSQKQEAFVVGVVAGTPPAQAAMEAGYSPHTASHQASRLLKNVHVAAEISRRRARIAARAEVAQADVLREWAIIAFSDIRNYVSIGQDGKFVVDDSRMPVEATKAIQEITQDVIVGRDGAFTTKTRIKLHSKTTALDALSKHLGLFEADKQQGLEAVDPGLAAIARRIAVMTDEEKAARLAELQARAITAGIEGVPTRAVAEDGQEDKERM